MEKDEIEISGEMIEAGGKALIGSRILSSPYVDIDEAVTQVFKAMIAAAKRHQPPSPNEQSHSSTR